MELLRITRQMQCSECVSFWGTSYSRPPIDPYLSYKILAAPLATIYSVSAAAIGDSNWWAPSTHLL